MNKTAAEYGVELEEKRTAYKTKFDGYERKDIGDGKTAPQIPADDLAELGKMREEIDEIGTKFTAARAAEDYEAINKEELEKLGKTGARPNFETKGKPGATKTLWEQLSDSDEFQGRTKRFMPEVELKLFDSRAELKTLMTTSSDGFPPEVLRDGNVVPAISRPPQLIDHLRMEPYTQNAIKFMKQTVRTNAAASKAEGAALDESTITYAEATDTIERIGTHIPLTEEQLEDEVEVQSLVENDLMLMVRQELDTQVTVGNGTPPILRGIFNATSILTQAKGTDPVISAFFKAITKIRVSGRATATVISMHSNDWQEIALQRTADGLYILGDPTKMTEPRLWGLPVVFSEALVEGNGLVLDGFYFRVKMRKGVTISITDSHDTEFIKNILRIRAHTRAGLQKLRDEAACQVTGI